MYILCIFFTLSKDILLLTQRRYRDCGIKYFTQARVVVFHFFVFSSCVCAPLIDDFGIFFLGGGGEQVNA